MKGKRKDTKPKQRDPRYDDEVGPRVPRNVYVRPLNLPPMRNIKKP